MNSSQNPIHHKAKQGAYALGLIGYPLGHSLSPQIHEAALHSLELNGEYRLYPVDPGQSEGREKGIGEYSLQGLLTQIRDGQIDGLNVTIPHKKNVIPLLDNLTPAAAAIGAVNTIFLKEDQLVGDNTDAPGFWGDLQQSTLSSSRPDHMPQHALVLGAGGSARAVVYALLIHGYKVIIAARRIEQAQEVSDQLSDIQEQYSAGGLATISISNIQSISSTDSESPISLIVNTTPVGMHPYEDASPWPDGLPLPKGAAVYDLVYNPRETLLVKQAYHSGLVASTGLGMLIEQAALAFVQWTGIDPPRDVMMEAVKG